MDCTAGMKTKSNGRWSLAEVLSGACPARQRGSIVAEICRISVVLLACGKVFLSGLIDAIAVHRCLFFLSRCSVIRKRVLLCFLLNGIVFLGVALLFSTIVLPLVVSVCRVILRTVYLGFTFGCWVPRLFSGSVHNTTNVVSLLFSEALERAEAKGANVIPSLEEYCWFVFRCIIMYPLYCCNSIFNVLWYLDVAEHATALLRAEQEAITSAAFIEGNNVDCKTLMRARRNSVHPHQYSCTRNKIPPNGAHRNGRQGCNCAKRDGFAGVGAVDAMMLRVLLQYVWWIVASVLLPLFPFGGSFLSTLNLCWMFSFSCFEWRRRGEGEYVYPPDILHLLFYPENQHVGNITMEGDRLVSNAMYYVEKGGSGTPGRTLVLGGSIHHRGVLDPCRTTRSASAGGESDKLCAVKATGVRQYKSELQRCAIRDDSAVPVPTSTVYTDEQRVTRYTWQRPNWGVDDCFKIRTVYLSAASALQEWLYAFEYHWIYFAGFGTPLCVVHLFSPVAVDLGIAALLLPLYILLALRATPIRCSSSARDPLLRCEVPFLSHFPIFLPVEALTKCILAWILDLVNGRTNSSIRPKLTCAFSGFDLLRFQFRESQLVRREQLRVWKRGNVIDQANSPPQESQSHHVRRCHSNAAIPDYCAATGRQDVRDSWPVRKLKQVEKIPNFQACINSDRDTWHTGWSMLHPYYRESRPKQKTLLSRLRSVWASTIGGSLEECLNQRKFTRRQQCRCRPRIQTPGNSRNMTDDTSRMSASSTAAHESYESAGIFVRRCGSESDRIPLQRSHLRQLDMQRERFRTHQHRTQRSPIAVCRKGHLKASCRHSGLRERDELRLCRVYSHLSAQRSEIDHNLGNDEMCGDKIPRP